MIQPSVLEPLTTMAAAARRRLSAARNLPDRGLHSYRRRAALARLRRGQLPRSILVLCYGNICRSPYAAERLRSSLRASLGSIRVLSAGFHKFGRPPPTTALAVASELGLDLAAHRSRLVDPALLEADLVIVMSKGQATMLRRLFGRRDGMLVLGDLDPRPIRARTIRDPLDQPDEVFREVYFRIDRCLGELVRALERRSPA